MKLSVQRVNSSGCLGRQGRIQASRASPGGCALSGGHWEPLKVITGSVRGRLAP